MKKVLVSTLVIGAGASVASADVFSYAFNPGVITNTASFYNIDTSGASGRARAFYVTGDWSVAGGDPWSNEFRVQLAGVTNQGGGALERTHGGVNNGNPFTFAPPAATAWGNNATKPVG